MGDASPADFMRQVSKSRARLERRIADLTLADAKELIDILRAKIKSLDSRKFHFSGHNQQKKMIDEAACHDLRRWTK